MTNLNDRLKESPSQTAGPYVHIGCVPSFAGLKGMYGGHDLGSVMTNERTAGERIRIEGTVIDGAGQPLHDGLVEIWQADHAGLFRGAGETRGEADPEFTGWGRQPTGKDGGTFAFETIKPGRVPYCDGRMQAPCVHFWVAARGVNLGLHTRMYFPDEPEANAVDPVLAMIDEPERISTLIARRDGDVLRFDIRLQGDRETVFFDV